MSSNEDQAKNLVNIKCAKCGHNKAQYTKIEGDEGIRRYQCDKCRNVWHVKVGGPAFNF